MEGRIIKLVKPRYLKKIKVSYLLALTQMPQAPLKHTTRYKWLTSRVWSEIVATTQDAPSPFYPIKRL